MRIIYIYDRLLKEGENVMLLMQGVYAALIRFVYNLVTEYESHLYCCWTVVFIFLLSNLSHNEMLGQET